MTRSDAGRKGGLITLERYGRDQLAEWGKLGGRPRLPTYDDIRQQQLPEQNNNHKEATGPPGGDNLVLLKKSAKDKLRRRSSGIPEIPQAGTAQETPHEQFGMRTQSRYLRKWRRRPKCLSIRNGMLRL